jgi:integrase
MKKHLHHLAQRGTAKVWHVVVQVPADLRSVFGSKHHLIKSLKTQNEHVAIIRRDGVLAELKAKIAEARKPGELQDWFKAAAEAAQQKVVPFSEYVRQADAFAGDYRRGGLGVTGESGYSRGFELAVAVDATAEDVEDRYGREAADMFHGIATGTATPMLHHLESWLSEGNRVEKTRKQYRKAVQRFADWLSQAGYAATVETIDKKLAGAYITVEMTDKNMDPVTANSLISPCRSYWTWLNKRGVVDGNPWDGQQFSKPKVRRAEGNKRPFSDAEIATLLKGNAPDPVADVIRIAALSGMRRSEIAALKVRDCTDGKFRVAVDSDGKNTNAVRVIPIHSGLTDIVQRLSADRTPGDWLVQVDGENRGDRIGKLFARYKAGLGVVDEIEGRRQDRVDFHSLRRWTITQMRKRFDQVVVADVVGHERGESTTDQVYVGQTGWDVMVACVEAVRLPG